MSRIVAPPPNVAYQASLQREEPIVACLRRAKNLLIAHLRWCSDGIWHGIAIGCEEGKEVSFLQEPEGGEVDHAGLHPP